MLPPFEPDVRGTGIQVLPRGIHPASLDEVAERFGGSPMRRLQMAGLRAGASLLEQAGCTVVYVDGSSVTTKEPPGDFDVVWDPAGVDPHGLDPVFGPPQFVRAPRAEQKRRFHGEFLPSYAVGSGGIPIVEFFQRRREGGYKGVVLVRLGGAA